MRRSIVPIALVLVMFTGVARADELTVLAVPSDVETSVSDALLAGEHKAKPRPLPTDEPPLPWFWLQIRQAVEASEERLPHHEEDEFYIVLSPTRVSNGFETVAGVGVKGHF